MCHLLREACPRRCTRNDDEDLSDFLSFLKKRIPPPKGIFFFFRAGARSHLRRMRLKLTEAQIWCTFDAVQKRVASNWQSIGYCAPDWALTESVSADDAH